MNRSCGIRFNKRLDNGDDGYDFWEGASVILSSQEMRISIDIYQFKGLPQGSALDSTPRGALIKPHTDSSGMIK